MKSNKWVLLAATGILTIGLSACSKDKEPDVQTPDNEPQVEETVLPNLDEANENQKEGSMEEAKEIHTGTGTFLGEVDEVSVELKVGTESVVFHLIDETKGIFEAVDPNTSVSFDYYEDGGKNYLVSLLINEEQNTVEKVEVTGEVVSDTWEFVGMIDGHSAEFKKGEEYIVAQYNNDLLESINGLDLEQRVQVEYVSNEYGQYVLQSVKK